MSDTKYTIATVAYALGDMDAAADDIINFSVDANHFEASLKESGSDTAVTAVRVNNGEQNVSLTTEDGIGVARCQTLFTTVR